MKEAVLPKVMMIGPGRNVMGGITTVVNSYFDLGLDRRCELSYLATMVDGNKLQKLLVAMVAYAKFCMTINRYNVVHVHMAAQASYTRKALFIKKAYQAGKRIIIHQHAADFDDFFFHQCNDEKRGEIRRVFAMADTVIVLSEEWAAFFGENVCDPNRIKILYNGVIMPSMQSRSYADHNVLFLGRLGERKGIYDLIKALPIVLRAVPDAMFYLGGDGDIEQCRRLVHEQGMADHVRFLGWVKAEEKEEYLRNCSTYVLPSHHEGMPMSVLEAMSYGCATISTNVGGIPQIIEHGVNGIRVDAGNVNDLAGNLIMVLTDKGMKTRLGQAGKMRIQERFDAARNVESLADMYRKKETLK